MRTTGVHALAPELDRVRDQVLEELAHLELVGDGRRAARRSRPSRSASWIVASRSEVTSSRDLCRGRSCTNGRLWVATRENVSRSSISSLHALTGRVRASPQVVAALLGEAVRVELVDTLLGERLHLAQRLLEVVGRDGGELVELGVRALELARAALERLVGLLELLVRLGKLTRVAKHPLPSRKNAKPPPTANRPRRSTKASTCALRLTEADRVLSGAVETTFHGEPSTGAVTKY